VREFEGLLRKRNPDDRDRQEDGLRVASIPCSLASLLGTTVPLPHEPLLLTTPDAKRGSTKETRLRATLHGGDGASEALNVNY
jgi:hypothetical protein